MVKEERVSQCPVRVVEAALQDYLKVAEMLERDRHTFHPLFDPLEYAHFAQKDFEDIARGGRKIWFAYADEVRESAPIGMVQLIFLYLFNWRTSSYGGGRGISWAKCEFGTLQIASRRSKKKGYSTNYVVR